MIKSNKFTRWIPSYVFGMQILSILLVLTSCNAQKANEEMNEEHKYTNELIHESSPYLLQHAHNPVNWMAWNDVTLAKAKEEGKLMIISIGYSACHWCHVMEHESFEDSAVAKLMNENFIPIKVDREERPDVDQIYMDACQLISGNGGWPLNAIALPDGRPVYAGTYYPKEDWLKVLSYFGELYSKDKAKLIEQADRLTAGIKEMESVPLESHASDFTTEHLEKVFKNWEQQLDFVKGGKRGAPKFPMPNNYEYLLKYYKASGDKKALEAVLVTLDWMAKGGIYDHLGGGFARYSVDGNWKVPHFEKMLYDNAQLVSLYSLAYQETKNERYKEIVEETLEFIERELKDKTGAIFSSLDADSEGEEGKFYVWGQQEIEDILGKDAEIFNNYFSVTPSGNWDGVNILYQTKSPEQVAKEENIGTEDLTALINKSKEKLYKERGKRIRPGLDDKILTSWNAMMISAYSDAYRVFRKKEYLESALEIAEFINAKCMSSDGRLNRNYKDGKSSINGFLDDYSFTIEAYTDLYQATFDEKWLDESVKLMEYSIEHFYDHETGLFFYTSDTDPGLIARKKELADNVIPSSNSSISKGLYTLGMYLFEMKYLNMAEQMMRSMLSSAEQYGSFYSNWAILLTNFVEEPYEIAVIGKDHEKIMKEFDEYYLPDVLFLGGDKEGKLELLQSKLVEGETIIYVCKNKACRMPVNTVSEAFEQMTGE